MFRNRVELLLVVTMGLIVAFIPLTNGQLTANQERIGLSLKMTPNKTDLLPGEPLRITFVVSNQSSRPVETHTIHIGRGDIELLISFQGGPFKRYRGDWGYIDITVDKFALQPGQQMMAEAVVHFNHVRFDSVETHYAFPKPGSYTLKASFDYSIAKKQLVESSPIQIHVREPQGADRVVWDRIKDDRDIAYFIYQEGGAFVSSEGTSKRNRGERVVQTLRDIMATYPRSTYANYIEPALANYERNLREWRAGRIKMAEGTLIQAGQILRNGNRDYAIGMLRSHIDVFQDNGLFSHEVPLEGYIGLMHLMLKDYAKALEYLEPVGKAISQAPGNRIIIEAIAFARLATGDEQQAVQLVQGTRPERERGLVLQRFRERIKAGQPFTLDLYR